MAEKQKPQWHPAFYASIRIELEEESENLIFEREHMLGTKPTQIDVLIIKKEKEISIRKNIGKIFKKHNVLEYKSPSDSLSVDDFYKVYGYACFYKSQSQRADEIKIQDITITFVCKKHPVKLISHLRKIRNYQITEVEKGIYRISGDFIPMQIWVTKELSEEENLWLHSLSDNLRSKETARKLTREYEKHQKDIFYESVMDIIVRANKKTFGGERMCKALEELMADRFEEKMQEGKKIGEQEGISGAVKILQKLNLTREQIAESIMEQFQLTKQQAESYF